MCAVAIIFCLLYFVSVPKWPCSWGPINTFMKLADVCIHTGELVCIEERYAIFNRLFIIIVSVVNCGDGNSKYPSIYRSGYYRYIYICECECAFFVMS